MPPKFSRGESESDDESEYDAGSEYDGDESDDSSDTTPIKRARLSSSSTQFETSGYETEPSTRRVTRSMGTGGGTSAAAAQMDLSDAFSDDDDDIPISGGSHDEVDSESDQNPHDGKLSSPSTHSEDRERSPCSVYDSEDEEDDNDDQLSQQEWVKKKMNQWIDLGLAKTQRTFSKSEFQKFLKYGQTLLQSTEKVMPFEPADDWVDDTGIPEDVEEIVKALWARKKKVGTKEEKENQNHTRIMPSYTVVCRDIEGIPLPCNCSGTTYVDISNFRVHYRKHHTQSQRFKCKVDGCDYSSHSDHIQGVHQIMKQFGCALCGRKFTAIDNLNVHQECGHVDPKKHRLFAIEDGVLQFRQKKDGDEKVGHNGKGGIKQFYTVEWTHPITNDTKLALGYTGKKISHLLRTKFFGY